MGSFGKLRLFIFTVFFLFTYTHASTVHFTAAPSVIKANLTSFASMRCSLGDDDVTGGQIGKRSISSIPGDVLHVTAIHVTRNNGEGVAFVTPFDAPVADADLGNLQVKGDVSGTSSEGYIELTWKDPSQMAMGEYVCEVSIITKKHQTVTVTATLEVTMVTPTINDVISELFAAKADLQRFKDEQREANKDLKQQQNDLKTEQTELKTRFNQSREGVFEASTIFNGHYYFLSRQVLLDFANFDITCRLFGGYLAEITDKAEYDFLMKFVTVENVHQDQVFIGETDELHEGTWTYVYHGGVVNVTDWRDGMNGGTGSNCMALIGTWKGDGHTYNGMTTFPCKKPILERFLCEVPSDDLKP